MNLMNAFNFSYLKQNLKKSKVTLAFVSLILPVLSFVILLLQGTGNSITVVGFENISGLTMFGMYILPIVVSIILFHFVFKKKSVDFMGSMPIDRKTIFFTNTLGGIIILLVLLLVTTLLMMVAAWILPNLYIPPAAFLDYFCVFSISYIFVFTACNIGVSVSGNVVTTLIVTALVLFFAPYHHYMFQENLIPSDTTSFSYRCEDCTTIGYEEAICGGDSKCLENLRSDGYQVYMREEQEKSSYTTPFQIIASIMRYDTKNVFSSQNIMLGKMSLLILLYILVGYFLFSRKEMEICETSFKKFSTHQIVKILTLIPIVVFSCLILENASTLTWVLIICLLLIYNFIYDLVTRHSIVKIPMNLLHFALVFVIVTVVCFTCMGRNSVMHQSFQLSDVSNLGVQLSSFSDFGGNKTIKIQDKGMIFKLLEGLIPKSKETEEGEETQYERIDLEITIKGVPYKSFTNIDENVYQKLEEIVKNSKDYKAISLKNILKNQEIVVIDNGYLTLDKEGIQLLESVVQDKTNGNTDFGIPITIYTYENHKLKKYKIYSDIDSKFHQYVVKKYNFKANQLNRDKIFDISFESLDDSINYSVTDPSQSKKVMEYLLQNDLDYTKPIYKAYIYTRDRSYYYYTNVGEDILPYLTTYDHRGGYYGG